jgi:hypothetical protein
MGRERRQREHRLPRFPFHCYTNPEADLATKERALQKLAPVAEQASRFTADDPLLAFLTSL